jgi:16S rRNA (uracil1498-N3)-methyltransferase
MARFFLPKENIHGNRGVVQGEELRHLRRVLRLAPGDDITIFDDAGKEHDAVIHSVGSESAEIEITRSRDAQRSQR